jgi:hypothetical protein
VNKVVGKRDGLGVCDRWPSSFVPSVVWILIAIIGEDLDTRELCDAQQHARATFPFIDVYI